MPRPSAASGSRRFRATVRRQGVNPYVDVPLAVSRAFDRFARSGRIVVTGTLNGADVRASLVPAGGGRHRLFVNGAMRASSGVGVGDVATFDLRATHPSVVRPPSDVSKALRARPDARRAFECDVPVAPPGAGALHRRGANRRHARATDHQDDRSRAGEGDARAGARRLASALDLPALWQRVRQSQSVPLVQALRARSTVQRETGANPTTLRAVSRDGSAVRRGEGTPVPGQSRVHGARAIRRSGTCREVARMWDSGCRGGSRVRGSGRSRRSTQTRTCICYA